MGQKTSKLPYLPDEIIEEIILNIDSLDVIEQMYQSGGRTSKLIDHLTQTGIIQQNFTPLNIVEDETFTSYLQRLRSEHKEFFKRIVKFGKNWEIILNIIRCFIEQFGKENVINETSDKLEEYFQYTPEKAFETANFYINDIYKHPRKYKAKNVIDNYSIPLEVFEAIKLTHPYLYHSYFQDYASSRIQGPLDI